MTSLHRNCRIMVLEVLPLTGLIAISAIERYMLATKGPSLNALL